MVQSGATFETVVCDKQLWPELFNHLKTAIHLKTTSGRWLYANAASSRLWNHGPIDGRQTDVDCLPAEYLARFAQADAEVLCGAVEFTVPAPARTVLVRKSLISLAESKPLILTECQDITGSDAMAEGMALKAALQDLQTAQLQLVQHEKMSSLGQLMAGVAHEINNPVNFIYGNIRHAQSYMAELIELVGAYRSSYPLPADEVKTLLDDMDFDFLSADLPKVLSSMRIGAERIRAIVSSLRTFSRMDASDMKTVNLHDGLNSTLMILEHRFKANQQRPAISVRKRYGELPPVECYAGQLNQVFMNLLVNAIDALDEAVEDDLPAPLHIDIATWLEQRQAVVAIHNGGCGIPEHVQSRLFDPFFTTKPVGKGTGMGLSISYQIVNERHGGQLTCESSDTDGTTFTIAIPIKQSP